jgi:hypothetical protein
VQSLSKHFFRKALDPWTSKMGVVRLWASPKVKDAFLESGSPLSHLFRALATTLAYAFEQSNRSLGAFSQLQRLENIEIPELAFWCCRPDSTGPSLMLAIFRRDETVAWGAALERALDEP